MPAPAEFLPVPGICGHCLRKPCLKVYATGGMRGVPVEVKPADGVPFDCPALRENQPEFHAPLAGAMAPLAPARHVRLRRPRLLFPYWGGTLAGEIRKQAQLLRSAASLPNQKLAAEVPEAIETLIEEAKPKLSDPEWIFLAQPDDPNGEERVLSSASCKETVWCKVATENLLPGASIQFQIFLRGLGDVPDALLETVAGRVGENRNDNAAHAKFKIPKKFAGEDLEPHLDVLFFVAKQTAYGLECEGPDLELVPPPPMAIDVETLPTTTFAFDSVALNPEQLPQLQKSRKKLDGWRTSHPDGHVAVFGHADKTGSEEYNKGLSDKRGSVSLALLRHDAKAYDEFFEREKWGLRYLQRVLKALGHDPGPLDGIDGPKTKAAVNAFRASKNMAQTGQTDGPFRLKLFQAFFEAVGGSPLPDEALQNIKGEFRAGCSEFNPVEGDAEKAEKNRRVTWVLLDPRADIFLEFPCARADVKPCRAEVAAPGPRKCATFGCKFYDDLVRSEQNAGEDKDPLIAADWSAAKGVCGDKVKLTVSASFRPSGDLKVKLYQDGHPDTVLHEATVAADPKEMVLEVVLRQKWLDKAPRGAAEAKGVPLRAKVSEPGGQEIESSGTLLLEDLFQADAELFEKDFAWNGYSVHSKYRQKIDKGAYHVEVKERVLKAWGGYLLLSLPGDAFKGKAAGGPPWDRHRWGRVSGLGMQPDEYHDGTGWKKIPPGVINGGNYSAWGFIESGAKFVAVGRPAQSWPEAFAAYDYDGAKYVAKRKSWVDDCKTRWSRKFKIKRKGCAEPAAKDCCALPLDLDFSMERILKDEPHAISLCPGALRSNAAVFFYGENRVEVAAHEVGHLVGLPDEYPGGATDTAQPDGDGLVSGIDNDSLMGAGLSKVKRRHFATFLQTAKKIWKKALNRDDVFETVDP